MENNSKTENGGLSYDTKTIIVVLCLIFVYPVGIILMLVWMKWPWWVKLLVFIPSSLVALVVSGVVAAAILVAINPPAQIAKAKDAQTKDNAITVVNAVTRYYVETGSYPWGNKEEVYSSTDVGEEAWLDTLVTSGQIMEGSRQSIKEGKNLVLVKEASIKGEVVVCFEPETKSSGDIVCVPEKKETGN